MNFSFFKIPWRGFPTLFFLAFLLCLLRLFLDYAHAETDRFSIVPSFASQKGDWLMAPSSVTLKKNTWNFSQNSSYAYHPLELSLAGTRTDGIVDHLFVQQWGTGYGDIVNRDKRPNASAQDDQGNPRTEIRDAPIVGGCGHGYIRHPIYDGTHKTLFSKKSLESRVKDFPLPNHLLRGICCYLHSLHPVRKRP